MNATRFRIGTFLVLIALMWLTACGGSGDADSEPTSPPATEAPAPAEVATPTEPPAGGEETPAPTAEPSSEIPFDLPIMEGAVDLQVLEETGAVNYIMESTMIEDVIEFYKTEMVAQGWQDVSSSEIGLMATLIFETDEARVSVSLQANNIAESVNVQLIVKEK